MMEEKTNYDKVSDCISVDDRLSNADSVFINDVIDDVIADDDEPPTSAEGGRCGCAGCRTGCSGTRDGCSGGKCGFCVDCWSMGCIWIIVGCLYFFVIIPTGVLLILHGYTKGFAVTLALGILLLFIVTCAIPGAYIALRYRRTTRKLNLSALRAKHARLVDSDQHPRLTLSKVPEHLEGEAVAKSDGSSAKKLERQDGDKNFVRIV